MPEKIRQWKREHRDGIVISYVNTYLDVKAESDYCCASANAAKVILHVLANSDPGQPILFLPDVYLGFYAAKLLEQENQSLERLWLMMGACHVHDRIRPYHVEQQTAELSRRCGGGPSRVRLHQRLHAPDGARDDSCAHDAVSFHPRAWCSSSARRRKKSSSWPPRSAIFIHLSKAAPDKTIVPASPRGGLRLYETKYLAESLSFLARRHS